MTRSEHWATLVALALLVAGCDRSAPNGQPDATTKAAHATTPYTGSTNPPDRVEQGQIDVEPGLDTVSRVVGTEDIEVAGKPACALTVRYAGDIDQPVTWRGEPCSSLTMRFVTLGDLVTIGQDRKLASQTRESIAGLPGGKVLYAEGGHASAIFAPNEAGLLVRIDLAD